MSYANVVATLALLFAMSGGALAAGHYLITSTKQIKPSVLAQLKSKAGPAGAPGAQGAQGPQGSAGPAGKDGTNGTSGKDGVSVTGAAMAAGKEPAGKPCAGHGGSEFSAAGGTTYACNGQTGFTETLPSGKTEKGDWSLFGEVPGTIFEGEVGSSVSFTIPLASAPTVVYIREKEATPAGCSGSVTEPGAEKGHLCIFAAQEINTLKEPAGVVPYPHICASNVAADCASEFLAPHAADPYGFVIATLAEAKGLVLVGGSWAVTAE